jgi:hypothetical protein
MRNLNVQQWRPLHRPSSIPIRSIALTLALWYILGTLLHAAQRSSWLTSTWFQVSSNDPPKQMPPYTPLKPLPERVPCYGARGLLLPESPDDRLQYGKIGTPDYPVPFSGSQRELGIDLTWLSAAGRYGPYGFGEDGPAYNRSRVNWDKVDWGKLQDECFERNSHRFPFPAPSVRIADDVRFTSRQRTKIHPTPSWDKFDNTRRTALVLRSYEGYNYTAQDLWNIRSIITEAALNSGGEYAVVLLINIRKRHYNIYEAPDKYNQALKQLNLPPELKSIALLWDDSLLESWYPLVKEHSTEYQANQPLQLFALHYPEFDHYWQIEMDQRFLGDVGQYLDAVSAFARYEPRKQALERATYLYSDDVHGSYANFTREVDAANEGKSRAWGPIHIPDIQPIGPNPPTATPEEDDYWWGVGEDADVIVTSFCSDVLETRWAWQLYIKGFRQGYFTPRWCCPPAIMRGSRTLMLTVHEAQVKHGLSVPSEAVFPSFALWHGLKLSFPPQPAYMSPLRTKYNDETSRLPSEWEDKHHLPWFGHNPADSLDGTAHANPSSHANSGMTWWWTSTYTRIIMDVWLNNGLVGEDVPEMLAVENGIVYAPNMAMHPVKTQPSPA